MCGFVGGSEPTWPYERALQSLVHRGPDSEGLGVEGGVGLGMRRLSIIDVAGGRQPLENEDGSVRVVFNGEWDAPIADWRFMPSFYMNDSVEEPQYSETLTIGESCLFFHKSAHANEQSYWKEVIYIDLYTDRGGFRYRPFEGFEALER